MSSFPQRLRCHQPRGTSTSSSTQPWNGTFSWVHWGKKIATGWLVVWLISFIRSQNIDSLSLDFGCQPFKPSFTVVSPNQDSQPITKMRIFAAKLMHTHHLRCVAGFRGILYGSILVPRCCKLFPLHGWLQQNSPTCYFCIEFSGNVCMFRMFRNSCQSKSWGCWQLSDESSNVKLE